MNTNQFKRLYEKIRSGQSNASERRTYWNYTSLLFQAIENGYSGTNKLWCSKAEILTGYDQTRYIYAEYSTAYWRLRTVVGSTSATIVGVMFTDNSTCVELAHDLGSILLEGVQVKMPSTAPWCMAALLLLAANGEVICKECRFLYTLCEHSKRDQKAVLSL